MYLKKGLFDTDLATNKSIHYIFLQLDYALGCINKMTILGGSRFSIKKCLPTNASALEIEILFHKVFQPLSIPQRRCSICYNR